ncbi:hypothetical protein N5C97_08600 [Acinetobacter johnsonii]|uniref:Inorganic pyrophosphatase domain-containing protein n=2 Tax=Gammaproteobacteria TaxID=1236 RepID=A0AA42MB71_ACIJO|nr:hypothetical protein [Acinetobacter johnsonii]MDH0826558.1 hypothetical protein [Acinetobacter johnsonii]
MKITPIEKIKLSSERVGLVAQLKANELKGVDKIRASKRISEIVTLLKGGSVTATTVPEVPEDPFQNIDLSPFERIVQTGEITIETLQGAVDSTKMLLHSVSTPKVFVDAVNVVSQKASDGSLLDSLGQAGAVLLNELGQLIDSDGALEQTKHAGMLDSTNTPDETQRTAGDLKDLFRDSGWMEGSNGLLSNDSEQYQFRINENRLYTFDVEAYQGNIHMQTMTFNGISIQECMDFVNRYIQLVDNQLAFIKPEIGNGFNQSMAQNNTIQLPDAIAQTAGTSILNAGEKPTHEQLVNNDYHTAKLDISGMKIAIENPVASTRSGVDENGQPWQTQMSAHYGYFEDTLGADGDELDVFVALGTPHDYDGRVFVISQNDRHGNFDEHKVILGVATKTIAIQLYRSHYDENFSGAGSIVEMSVEDFKSRIYGGKTAMLDSIQGAMMDSWVNDGKFELWPVRKLDLSIIDQGMNEAKATIKDPIVLFHQGSKSYVVHGRKRLEIAKANGEKFIPAITFDAGDHYTTADIKTAIRKCGNIVHAEALGAMIELTASKRLESELE